MEKYDVVYILKNNIDPTELRYSIRSVVKNFPYRKIWFYGGRPSSIIPDEGVYFEQIGSSKYEKAAYAWKKVFQNNQITEDFWLFNDDFFVMSKINDVLPIVNGTLYHHIKKIEKRNGSVSGYSRKLGRTMEYLKDHGYDYLNYEVHIPMLINRKKALDVINTPNYNYAFRSMYGNIYTVAARLEPDVKIVKLDEEPDPDIHNHYLSTSNDSFRDGVVGRYIRDRFTESTRYEL